MGNKTKIYWIICILIPLFLCVGCENYSSEPYDEWEAKLRRTNPASKMKKMVIKDNWQKYDSLSYLRFTNLEEILLDTDSIPPWIVRFKKLRLLYSYDTKIKHIPEDICKLSKLEYIALVNTELETIPVSIKDVKQLRSLVLSGNKITQIPMFLTEIDTLYHLSLDGNNITEVPDYICQIRGLESLILSGNKIRRLPECIGSMSQLEYLSLYKNEITELPESIANLPLLEELSISDNPITKLPEKLFVNPNRLTDIYLYGTPLKDNEQVKSQIKELERKNRQKKRKEYLKEKGIE